MGDWQMARQIPRWIHIILCNDQVFIQFTLISKFVTRDTHRSVPPSVPRSMSFFVTFSPKVIFWFRLSSSYCVLTIFFGATWCLSNTTCWFFGNCPTFSIVFLELPDIFIVVFPAVPKIFLAFPLELSWCYSTPLELFFGSTQHVLNFFWHCPMSRNNISSTLPDVPSHFHLLFQQSLYISNFYLQFYNFILYLFTYLYPF
jgi:hypothetical protein